jgi:glutamine amidotransferase PdxT
MWRDFSCWWYCDGVYVVAVFNLRNVAVENGKYPALSFHPELSGDTRLYERLLKKIGI